LSFAARFKEDDEAVLMANDTEYGLAAYFYTRDLRRAWTIAEQLEYGMVRKQAVHFRIVVLLEFCLQHTRLKSAMPGPLQSSWSMAW
jgi:hypothetical protein